MENILNGFEAIFDTINNNIGKEDKIDVSKVEESFEEITEEELQNLKGKGKEELEDEGKEETIIEVKKNDKKGKSDADSIDDTNDGANSNIGDATDNDAIDESNEEIIVTGFFDSLAEKIGWDSEEEDKKPKTVEDLVEYFKDVIEENSAPEYASDEIARLDQFVKDGGNIKDYFTIDATLDIDNINLEDENDQKSVVKEFLKEKGFSIKSIEKKLVKYEEAGLLEDEAEDAIDALKEIRENKKEQLLVNQQKAALKAKTEQQAFFTNVVSEIKGMKDIRGISIPEKDKQVLVEYIFKQDADGRSKYQKDYAKSIKNLLESAYFTMKGDTLLSVAKSEGKKDAINNFKNSLKSNSGIDKKSKKEIKTSDDSLWSSFTRQLRVA